VFLCSTQTLQNGRSLDLLAKVFLAVSGKEKVSNAAWSSDTSTGSVSGEEFKDIVLHKLCIKKWPSACTARIVDVLRDIEMSSEQLSFVIKKATENMTSIEPEELPPLVYQLLLLSTKVRGT
jgi:fanconi anemia group I protein